MRALDGIVVLEFANYVSGPYAGMMLADLGAEVIKIESPDGGDPFRGWGAADYSATFGSLNRNKKSVILDLKSPDGLAAARALSADADVLIENFRAGTMERLGLGYEKLCAANPRLIYTSITGFGGTGPYAERAGYDTVGQAMSGLLSVLTDSANPQPMGISLSDHLTGMMAAYGILGALMAREKTGRGQRVETSLLAATIAFLGENAARFFETGKTPSRETRARSAQVYAFVDCDGRGFVVHLSSPAKFWQGVTRVANHPEWQDDARFKSKRDRQENYRVLHGLLAEIFLTRPREHWLALLLEQDVPAAPINTLDEVFADPQVIHLGLKRQVPHKKLGQISLVGGGVNLSETPTEIRSAAPDYGQHTDEIIARIGKGKARGRGHMIQPAKSMRNSCAIVGAGNSRLGQVPGVSSLDLLIEAISNALDDAGLKPADIDGIITRGPDDAYCHHQQIGERLGINARFSTSLDNGGASQILSVALAVMAIEAGLASTVICGYGRDAWSRTHKSDAARVKNQTRPDDQHAQEFGPEYGYFGAVAAHAFGATRHMHEFGTTREQFAEIAVAFREHAMRNPDAQIQKPLTVEDYFKARQIVSPFGLFDCSLRSDGAGAVIVTTAERARDMKAPPVFIRGFGSFNNLTGWFADENMIHTAAKQSGEAAFSMAGIGPSDVDTAQLYDCFTYMVLVQLEDYGFCQKGEGGPFVQSGALRLAGALPTNTSGGQLSEAHVEGMLQIVEGVRQLRHVYPTERQVKDAHIALISGHGGNQVCHSTLVLERG